MTNSPAIKFRDGCLQVVVWRNTGDRGHYYTATPQRSYKAGDDAWKETDSLRVVSKPSRRRLVPPHSCGGRTDAGAGDR